MLWNMRVFYAYEVFPIEHGENFFESTNNPVNTAFGNNTFDISDLCMQATFIDCIRITDTEMLMQET